MYPLLHWARSTPPQAQKGQSNEDQVTAIPPSRAHEVIATTVGVTALCAISLMGLLIHATETGLGMHIYGLTILELSSMSLHLWIAYIFFNFSVGITKISIVLSYLRLFASSKGTRTACLVFLCILILNTVVSVTCCILTCHPISFFWHPELFTTPEVVNEHCVNVKAMWFFQGYTYIFFDLVLIVLPIPVVKSLNISRRERWALGGIFALGGFGCICSFLRIHSLTRAIGSQDPGWDNVDSARWAVIEVAVGIICASLPQCKTLLTRLFPRFLSPNRRSRDVTFAVSGFDKGHGWNSLLEKGIRMDAAQKNQMSRKGGLVQSMVERGAPDDEVDRFWGEATGASAILVTTTMTQRRESHCPSVESIEEVSRRNSITPSEVSLPPFLTED
ncbi:uncharacterized protein BKCO1_6100027 [Diplodia corticola]|uniref:Integral membrane protein n=1 Tax=Diplodia corticola TaxID=236234 RepID=A0A1J9QPK9_9PEZI|nr:uncharacterized protein BKCO1_6100027 [Diplodia corticola]OJD30392.1 integral membrane protein [Diplodia corticola]